MIFIGRDAHEVSLPHSFLLTIGSSSNAWLGDLTSSGIYVIAKQLVPLRKQQIAG